MQAGVFEQKVGGLDAYCIYGKYGNTIFCLIKKACIIWEIIFLIFAFNFDFLFLKLSIGAEM